MLKLLYILLFLPIGIIAPPPVENRKVEKIEFGPHLEGVPIERDGDININFRQEIILNESETIKNPKDTEKAIRNMFNSTDTNLDGFLSTEELEEKIQKNLKEHLSKSMAEAVEKFKIIDENGNGKVTWEEFLPHFASDEGDEHKDENGKHVMNKDDANSDDNNDGELSSEEWLAFLHPEHSRRGLFSLAEDIIRVYDRNNDTMISRDEFVNGVPGSVEEENVEFQKMEKEEKVRRLREFDNDIDIDKDGKATFSEIFEYVNPKNVRQVKSEVAEIMLIADVNQDGKLSLTELLDRDWLLMSTALISASNRLHDEM
ncbi:unnamed protein product [Caenorhabditis angaria]|uniref:EF-hand domain-containing protein n=1 Tax=Caenorhabditis angaria TaxID=860376 RepID=A0A9P1IEG7_9PELO|nr:unnamed protein product [Caenorhabditis angaria]